MYEILRNMKLLWFVLVVTLFKHHSCFLDEECGVHPVDGCACYDKQHSHVICVDLGLTTLPPMGLISLGYLDLSNNSFTQITDGFFGECTIQELRIDYNQNELFFTENVLSMRQKASLEELHLTHNALDRIPLLVRNLPSLTTLDLTYNDIEMINGTSLDGLSSLRRLDLRGNPIYAISKQAYLDLSDLQELGITFRYVEGRGEGLSEIFGPDDSERSTSFHEITRLALSDVNLKHFKFLWPFSNLETLSMNNCDLEDISLQTYDTALLYSRANLQTINLAHNELNEFPPALIDSCRSITHIDVSHNNIDKILNMDSIGTSFEYINLSHNRLRILSPYHLSRYTKLTHLDLSNNRISRIRPGSFETLTNLHFLDLSDNILMTLRRTSFPPVLNIGLIMIIRGNSFQCECKMDWLIQAIGEQASTGVGPFDWYDVHNVACGAKPMLEIFHEEPDRCAHWLLEI